MKMISTLFLLLALAIGAQAQTVTVIDFPEADFTSAFGINETDQIVGRYFKSGGIFGFLYDTGVFTTLPIEIARDINGNSDIVGFTNNRGRLIRAGVVTEIIYPGSVLTRINGINDAGLMVGEQVTPGFPQRGFTYDGVTFTDIPLPADINGPMDVFGINNFGQIVGDYAAQGSVSKGFILTGAVFQTFDLPNGSGNAQGINDFGVVAGRTFNENGTVSGFTFNGLLLTLIVIEGSVNTDATAINNAGKIVGEFTASPAHGFLREPKREPKQNIRKLCREFGFDRDECPVQESRRGRD